MANLESGRSIDDWLDWYESFSEDRVYYCWSTPEFDYCGAIASAADRLLHFPRRIRWTSWYFRLASRRSKCESKEIDGWRLPSFADRNLRRENFRGWCARDLMRRPSMKRLAMNWFGRSHHRIDQNWLNQFSSDPMLWWCELIARNRTGKHQYCPDKRARGTVDRGESEGMIMTFVRETWFDTRRESLFDGHVLMI